jgi:hypothetical protein
MPWFGTNYLLEQPVELDLHPIRLLACDSRCQAFARLLGNRKIDAYLGKSFANRRGVHLLLCYKRLTYPRGMFTEGARCVPSLFRWIKPLFATDAVSEFPSSLWADEKARFRKLAHLVCEIILQRATRPVVPTTSAAASTLGKQAGAC